jgi:predicted dinucleotide-binding enzyme
MVGRTLSAKLAQLGHEVTIGTRDVAGTLARSGADAMGNAPFAVWHKEYPAIRLERFVDAARRGEIVVNATSGHTSLDALNLAGAGNLEGKVLMDVSNPLDFSRGMPPSLSVANTDSLGEQIQRAFPAAKVVKTLNTVNAYLMVDPARLAAADHTMFVCGNDAEAKAQVSGFLKGWFGWKDVLDLGDITSARGTEMYLPLWLRLWGAVGSPQFSIKVVR